METILLIVVVLAIFIPLLLFFGTIFYSFLYPVFIRIRHFVLGTKTVGRIFINIEEKERLAQFYTKHFSYYKLLNEEEKHKFITRIITFRKQNQIHIKPTVISTDDEIELMINGAFVQITFGYSDFYKMNRFNKIVIHPNTFFSKLINRQVKGLTVSSGVIHYSWNDFVKGYKDENDNINLGLHELAHAFYEETFTSEDLDWKLWKTKAFTALDQERTQQRPFFRTYGQTNLAEFWAVAVEVFFENPIRFKESYPSLYNATALILKQDMALRNTHV